MGYLVAAAGTVIGFLAWSYLAPRIVPQAASPNGALMFGIIVGLLAAISLVG